MIKSSAFENIYIDHLDQIVCFWKHLYIPSWLNHLLLKTFVKCCEKSCSPRCSLIMFHYLSYRIFCDIIIINQFNYYECGMKMSGDLSSTIRPSWNIYRNDVKTMKFRKNRNCYHPITLCEEEVEVKTRLLNIIVNETLQLIISSVLTNCYVHKKKLYRNSSNISKVQKNVLWRYYSSFDRIFLQTNKIDMYEKNSKATVISGRR